MAVADRPAAAPTVGRTAARLLTEVLAPAPVASLLLVVVAWHSAPTSAALGALVAASVFSLLR